MRATEGQILQAAATIAAAIIGSRRDIDNDMSKAGIVDIAVSMAHELAESISVERDPLPDKDAMFAQLKDIYADAHTRELSRSALKQRIRTALQCDINTSEVYLQQAARLGFVVMVPKGNNRTLCVLNTGPQK